MEKEKSLMDKMMDMFFKLPKVSKTIKLNKFDFNLYENNAVGFVQNGVLYHKFFSEAKTKDNRYISTKTAKLKKFILNNDIINVIFEENGIRLTQIIDNLLNEDVFTIKVRIENVDGNMIESNYIRVLDFSYPDKECDSLFLSLDQKMLLMPYDNDMWVRYESTPLRPGRTSYELTCIYDEDSLRGMLVGAIDFDNFKNAIRCSDHDARVYYAFSGCADDGTHDIVPHGYISGEYVESSRFVCGFFSDIRDSLELYGRLAINNKEKMVWNNETPFGWNSYSAGCMTLEQWEEAGKFLHDECINFSDLHNATYINLDANFMLNKTKMKKIVDELHKKGQKAGNYLAPAVGMEGLEFINPLKGSKGYKYKDIIMKFPDGMLYPKIDGGKPVDVTHPAFIKNLEYHINEIVDMGFDYLKVDFTSHAGVEGIRYDKSITTGRQALYFFYRTLKNLIDPKKIGREIFLDFSISPLLPGGFSHARRSSCDAFGHHEDVRYVLNALNYGWWQSGTLYSLNDPDHTVLYKSKMDNRDITDYNSAKSRYNASLISGTVMLLSDNYGPYGKKEEIDEARRRTKEIVNNKALNEIALFKKPFRPAFIKSDTTNVYYLKHDERMFVAIFNFKNSKEEYSVNANYLGFPSSGNILDLRTNESSSYNKDIKVLLEPYDSIILEVK